MDSRVRLQLPIVFVFLLNCCYFSFGVPHTFKQDVCDQFYSHTVVQPKLYTETRQKRDIRSTQAHDDRLSLVFVAFGKDFVVDLRINKDLLPGHYFEKHHENGSHVTNHPMKNGGNHCHYQGQVKGCSKSWAAISTCDGISGIIHDGNELHFIEPDHLSSNDSHYVFRSSDIKDRNLTCGISVGENVPGRYQILGNLQKRGRSAVLPSPYKSDSKTRYVEMVLVNDYGLFKEFNENETILFERSKQIANIINGLYSPLNILVALVGVVVWSDHDEIPLSTDSDQTLTQFLHYRRQRLAIEHPNDFAQLLTFIQFDGGVVNKALKGAICSHLYSGGVSMVHSAVVGITATDVAHSLGHNLGMENDTPDCQCPDHRCIMAPSSSSVPPRHWSSCSREYLALTFSQGMDYCLRNRPTNVSGPVCGNGFLEEDEECDCGLKEFCESNCCNALTCQLFSNATCGSGECCDLNTCQMKSASTVCREETSECDLPEYCDGLSEFCPPDVFVQNGMVCVGKKAYCIDGHCSDHDDQCKLLWGETGKMSDLKCYSQNVKGNSNGNCGYDRLNETYTACEADDVLCGRLHCTHLSGELKFGFETTGILSRSFINERGKIFTCRSVALDVGLSSTDPGLVPNGAKCGDEKVCFNQMCVPVSSVQEPDCPHNCSGNGICNSKGNCHCEVGYSPPNCDSPGPGGSIDSGPASEPPIDTSFWSKCKSRFFALFFW